MQHVLPQHGLSRLVLRATRSRVPWFKDALIRPFVRHFKPRMEDAAEPDPHAYASFNEFFTRALRPGIRPLAADPQALVSPVDGAVSAAGSIDHVRLLQAKGRYYTLEALLAGAAASWAPRFEHGQFATIYLAPFDYHRIHMPCDGVLREAWYVPGRLFSVNTVTAASVDNLFARNERVVLLFDGPVGAWALIMVGALNVGSMTTVWHGDVTPRRPRRAVAVPPTSSTPHALPRGAELGRFNMGSTVILLFERERVRLDAALSPGRRLLLGEEIGRLA